jgi:magnesium transporter
MSQVLENLKEYMDPLNEEQIKGVVQGLSVPELLVVWDMLNDEESLRIFLHLDQEARSNLMMELPTPEQERLLQTLSVRDSRDLLDYMEPDDLTDLIQNLSPEVRTAVWNNLSEEARREMEFLLRFDEDDAAGLMTPRYVAVRAELTVAQALAFVRKVMNDMEMIYYVYVVDQLKRLIGVVSLRQLLSARDNQKISGIMTQQVISVREETDQEQTARVLEENGLIALPVVDKINRILGIVTFDDVIEVIREEQTEDIYKMGALGGDTKSYLETGIFGLVWKRLPWLVILLLTGTITTNVLHGYEGLLMSAAFLTLFIPVITQTGGNTGTQSATLMIRGLATGEIRFKDVGRVLIRELAVSAIIGFATGLIIFARGVFLPPGIPWHQGIAVAASLSCVVVFSTVLGALVPMGLSRMGVDPTVAAGPLMSTLIDVTGLTIYFEVSKRILGL